MRAAYFTTEGRFEIRDIARPKPGPGEVLVAVHACGICGSDLHYYTGASVGPLVCPGHEICGLVAAGSRELEVGTPVVVEPLKGCEACAQCKSGQPNLCPQVEILGSRLAGGFADAVIAPTSAVYPVPAGLSLDVAMLTEPLAVAIHAVALGKVGAGHEVLVLGGGVIGSLVTFVAARRGSSVIASVRHPHQAEFARVLGARRVIATERVAVRSSVAERPPDVVFETVGGTAETLDVALECVRPGGRIVVLGVFTAAPTFPPLRFLAKEAHLVGVDDVPSPTGSRFRRRARALAGGT